MSCKSNIVDEAKICNETNNECKRYPGASETLFKERFRNHTRDLKHKIHEKCTELSKYTCTYGILYLPHGIAPIVTWNIVKRVSSKTSAN